MMSRDWRDGSKVEVSFLIPAHNEAPTIGAVVVACQDAARQLGLSSEVIVISDCSTDATSGVASDQGADVIERFGERGSKAEAVRLGIELSTGRLVFLVDGDLVGLQGQHLADIALPVLRGEVLMSVGTFDYRRGGRFVQRAPWSTGERIIPREMLNSSDGRLQGYNLEFLMNESVGRVGGLTASQRMLGVRQRSKAAKTSSRRRGILANILMWTEISVSVQVPSAVRAMTQLAASTARR
jgi:glycosyltransferase involved in cell wall biosynthesis